MPFFLSPQVTIKVVKTKTPLNASVSETVANKPAEKQTKTDIKPTAETTASEVTAQTEAADSRSASEKVEIPSTSTTTDTEEAAASRPVTTRSKVAESKVTLLLLFCHSV